VRGKNIIDYLLVAWDLLTGSRRYPRHIRHLSAQKTIKVMVDKETPVQGDGDPIGETPLEVKVIPGAVKIFVSSKEFDPSLVNSP
jgi:diacylglycerol kinase family enzyme